MSSESQTKGVGNGEIEKEKTAQDDDKKEEKENERGKEEKEDGEEEDDDDEEDDEEEEEADDNEGDDSITETLQFTGPAKRKKESASNVQIDQLARHGYSKPETQFAAATVSAAPAPPRPAVEPVIAAAAETTETHVYDEKWNKRTDKIGALTEPPLKKLKNEKEKETLTTRQRNKRQQQRGQAVFTLKGSRDFGAHNSYDG